MDSRDMLRILVDSLKYKLIAFQSLEQYPIDNYTEKEIKDRYELFNSNYDDARILATTGIKLYGMDKFFLIELVRSDYMKSEFDKIYCNILDKIDCYKSK